MATIKDLAEQYGVAKAQDQNENLGRLAEMLGSARDIGNQYKVPSWVPLAGGTGAGDLLMGRTPEEIENWSYGNAPMQIPEMSNVPQFKRGRAQSLADALTTLAPGVKATEDLPVGMAIKGYHGSPHKFKEFDTAHMGSGEGGQAYGWGNYITEDPYVATTYSPQDEWMNEQLMNLYNQAERRQDYPSMEVYERYMMHERPNEVKEYLNESYADYPEDLPKRLPAQKIGENLYKKQKGSHLYEVSMEFPKEREAVDPMSIEHFLDYDKPLSEQSDYVRNILQSHDPDIYHPEGPDYDPAEKGSSILSRFGSGKEGAQKLYELGIPGTTYMGEKAKVANPEGVRNFVTYSDEVPRVVTRNMNKVKPLTNEDRLNDLEKQMSAYMKTKRMPKGVDFKTGSDWYDWAYDKRAKLRGYAQGGSVDKDSLQLNKPRRTPNHPTKSHIVKTMVDGKEKIIRFGEQGAETAGKPKEGESDRMTAKRESFKARHAKNIAKGPSSAAYWANKVKWAEGGEVDIRDDEGYADDLARLKRAYENSNFGPNDSMIASTIRHPAEAVRRAGDWLQEKERILSGRPYEDDFTPEDQALAGLDIAGLAETGSMPFAPISAGGTLGTTYIPEKTVNAYKLFRFKDKDPEVDYPLFVNANKPIPRDAWVPAEAGAFSTKPGTEDKVKSGIGPLAYRPGWHAGDLPIATHIGKGGKPPVYRPYDHRWSEVEFPDDVDWQSIANERGINKKGKLIAQEAHITDQIPFGGYYRYKTSPNMTGEWLISGDMKLGTHLSDEEVKAINEASGLGVEDLPRFREYLNRNMGNPAELSRVIDSDAGKAEYFQMLKKAKDNELEDLMRMYGQHTDEAALKAMDKRYNKYLKQGYAEGGSVDAQDDEGYLDDLNRLKKAYERSNFGPNDSVIASTIHHPIEAAKRAKDSLMRSIDTASGVPREILDESSAFPFGVAPSMDEQAQAGLDLAGLMQTGAMPFAPESAGGTLGTLHKFRIGDLGYDLRFDDRKLEQDKLQNMVLQLSRPENEKRIISLANYEGYPWVTSMSDRTNVGNLHYINDRPVDVDLQGGQDYMFNNPGQVWASAQAPVNAIMKYGKELSERAGGLDPLYMPWRMAPTGGDYANMTGETMLKYMRSNMNKKEQRAVNKGIKDFIPDFKGIESEEGIDQFRNAPDKVRKALKNHLDTKYRNAGGISIGEARLAVADPSQLLAPDTGLQNVGQIYIGNPIIQESGHRAYPRGVPGQGLGVLDRDVMAYDLMPEVAEYRGLIDLKNPRTTDIRAIQMKPYGGIITDKILKNLGYAKGGEVKALHDKYAEGGSVNTTPISYGFEYDQMANSLGLNNINYGGLNSGSTKTTTDTPKTIDTTPVTSGLSALTDTPIENASTTVDTPASVTSEISALTSTPIEKAITTDTTPAPKSKGLYYDAEYNPTGTLVPTGRGDSRSNPGFKDAVARYQRDKDGVWHDYAIEGVSKWDLGSFTPLTSRQGLEAMIATKQQAADDALATQKQVIAMQHDPLNRNWNDTMANPLKDLNNPAYLAQQEVLKYQKELADLGSYTPYTPSSWWTGYAKGGSVKDLHNKYEESDYGYGNRPDKTKKGLGYFGELERPDGTGVMTEYSIGVPINGKEMDVPTLVPTLTPDEIRLILHMQEGEDMPRSIVHKAIDHAHQRLSEGKPIFATEEDLYAHGGIVDVLHNDAIEQIMKAFMDSMADDEEPSAPAVSIEITTQNTETPQRGKIPKSIAREAKHG